LRVARPISRTVMSLGRGTAGNKGVDYEGERTLNPEPNI
jgi:hypothetical protein